MARALFSESVERELCKELHLTTIGDTLDRDFDAASAPVERSAVAMFAASCRGSARLGRGLFVTPQEFEAEIARARALKLP